MKITPQTFLTADTHFGHSKIFETWGKRSPSFNEDLIKNWNSVVDKNDTIIHLGDLTMTNKEATAKWTSQLRGRKYLIWGNHDGSSTSWYSDLGFQTLPDLFYTFKDKYGVEYRILITHEPVFDLPEGYYNIHGHLHGDTHRPEHELATDKHFDVGVDAHNLTPIRLSVVLDYFKNLSSGGLTPSQLSNFSYYIDKHKISGIVPYGPDQKEQS